MAKRRVLSRTKTREAFLNALRIGSSVASAARAVHVTRQAAYKERELDEAFAAEWDEAIEEGTDRLEDTALRRATHGSPRNVYFQGQVVGQEMEVSDTLLIFLLKARRPDKFRERFDLSNSDGTLRGFAEAMRQLDRVDGADGPAVTPVH